MKPCFIITALTLALLTGCQQVNTTQAGAVGATRKQKMSTLLPSEQVDQMAAAAYSQTINEARQKNVLLPANHPTTLRVKKIAERLIPQTGVFRPEAVNWKWEVNVEHNKQLNAYCMAGGKIMFFTGIIDQLKLSDDEIAQIMGHEISHALREHSRERMSEEYNKQMGMRGISVAASILGGGKYADLTNTALGVGSQAYDLALALPNSRTHESEADMMGLELAARAGYNPQAAVSLWQKMAAANRGAPPEFLSTHPSSQTRIAELQAKIPLVQPLYDASVKQPAPPASNGKKKKG
ncbi:M48 family metallopeptidase [Chitinibacter fontanus]|uniref:M48 family metallopeptidase n=1 Tax=Chitinibacter fontanus TaxID=1737446 RepID=A0A7D5Z5S9_9NEIS|nr:M48 family metallopeptidase [Chitinibacter fontanus]QLI81443.1 M48 family metallopeptidase [Chitinibacter fontanus]